MAGQAKQPISASKAMSRQRNSHQSSAPAKNVAFDLIHGAHKIRYGDRSTTCSTSIQLHNLHAPNCGSHQHYLPRLHAISQHPVIETIFQSQISPSDPSTQRWLRSDLLRIHAAQGACSGRLPESHLMCSLLAGIGWHEIGS